MSKYLGFLGYTRAMGRAHVYFLDSLCSSLRPSMYMYMPLLAYQLGKFRSHVAVLKIIPIPGQPDGSLGHIFFI